MKHEIVTFRPDLAMNVVEDDAIGYDGAIVVRREFSRGEMTGFFSKLSSGLVGFEACAPVRGSRARASASGHVAHMVPACVKRQVDRDTDAADAEAIC